MKAAGCTIDELKAAGCTAAEMKAAGHTTTAIKAAGCLVPDFGGDMTAAEYTF